jgi:hypothetical protein
VTDAVSQTSTARNANPVIIYVPEYPTVKVLSPGGMSGLGRNDAVVPAGWPVEVSVTVLLNPLIAPTFTV